MKKNEIFRKKNLMQIVLKKEYAVVAIKKKVTGYEHGVICIKDMDGNTLLYSTLSENNIHGIVCYTGIPNRIEFLDKALENNWNKILVYLFDSDGAFFLCSDRKLLEETGMWNVFVSAYDINELRKNVLNIASLFDEKLCKLIFCLEKQKSKILLTDEGDYNE